MWRIAAILAAIAAFVYIAVVGVQWLQPRVEDDILNRVNAALAEQGMLWADVTVSGRQVVLGGHAPDEANRAEALNVASRVFGVASVSDATVVGAGTATTALTPVGKPTGAYQLTIEKKENTLIVSGEVASDADAAVIRRIVATHFPDMQVQDSLKVNPHAPAGWRSAVGVVLMNMTNLEKASVTISNTEVMLQGEVLDQKYSDQLQEAIKQALPKGYKAGFAVDVVTPAALAQEEAQDSSATTTASGTLPAVATPSDKVAAIAPAQTVSDSIVTTSSETQTGFLSRLWSSISGETSSTVTTGETVSGSLISSMTTALNTTVTSVTTMVHHHHHKHDKAAKTAPVMTMTSHTTVAAVNTPAVVTATTPTPAKLATTTDTSETPLAENPTALSSTDCHGIKRVAHTVIYFGFDKAGLPQTARPVIHHVATTLKACPAQHVTVNGYTDSTGSQLYNKWLSEQRADSGVRALRRQGVPAEQLSAVGHGEHHVKVKGESAASAKAMRAHSRRIEFHPDGHPVAMPADTTAHAAGHTGAHTKGHKAKAATVVMTSDTTPAAPASAESGWWNSLFNASGTTPAGNPDAQ